MNIKKFFSMFDKKRFLSVAKIGILFFSLVIVVNVIGVAYSRYESKAELYGNANVALFLVSQGTAMESIALNDLVPSDDPYIYTINVKNYEGAKKANVNLKYTISFKTTTNLPLELEVICNETYSAGAQNIIDSTETIQDGDVYYIEYKDDEVREFDYNNKELDQFNLIVRFPKEYKDYPDLYQGKLDLITITVHAEQLV